jgi:hypothetical protein
MKAALRKKIGLSASLPKDKANEGKLMKDDSDKKEDL